MDSFIHNALIATLDPGREGYGRDGYGLVAGGALAIAAGRIAWVGELDAAPPQCRAARQVIDAGGRLLTPGLIDCHSHAVFGGDRSHEFARRLAGEEYAQIARDGGGIMATVRATRAASEDELLEAALARVDDLCAGGVTTLEIKSGYGLNLFEEAKMLRVARRIGELRPLRVVTSFLGAHALPGEFAGHADEYIEHLCEAVLPALHGERLVDAVDGFCESIAFSAAQLARLFVHARELGLPVKLHAEQLSNCGGSAMAARFDALSVDHLEYLDAAGVAALAEAGCVAVLLPGAFYCLRGKRPPPVAALRAAGVPIAVASDLNPGSSPLRSLPLAMHLGCQLFGLTPLEALAGTTRHAARALGLGERCGQIAPGFDADLALWDLPHPEALVYEFGHNPCAGRFVAGHPVALDFAGALA